MQFNRRNAHLVGASGRLRPLVRNVVKKAVLRSAEYLGYYNIAKRRRKGATVLCYHGVEENIYDNRVQYLQTPLSLFEQQIQYLRTNFEIISIDYLYDCMKNDYKLHPSQVLITFDDGYKNNFEIVTPFLRGYDIPFTVFVSTSNVCNGTRFPAYYLHAGIFYTSQDFFECKSSNRKYDISTPEKRRLANGDLLKRMKTSSQEQVAALVDELARLLPPDRWDEVNGIFCSEEPLNWGAVTTMKNMGVTIGSHCHEHAILHVGQSDDQIKYQLRMSKDLIQNNIGDCKYFAYPNGGVNDISPAAVREVMNCKYQLGFTTVRGQIEDNSNIYILPRICACEKLDRFKFHVCSNLRYGDEYKKFTSKIVYEMN